MAKTLVQYALKNGSQDNVSVLVLKFKWRRRYRDQMREWEDREWYVFELIDIILLI